MTADATRRTGLQLENRDSKSRASRRHPARREVPLGTRKLELVLQRPLAATRLSKNNLRPRAWAEISPWRPPLPHAAGRNTPLNATRLRLPLAATESLLSHPAPLNGHWPRAWGNLVRTTIVVLTISLLRRGARGLEGTALRGQRSLRRAGGAARHPKAGVGSATSFDCPARAAAVEDQPKQRKPQ